MSEDELRIALRIAMRALNIIIDTGAVLKGQLDEDAIDAEYAFASLYSLAESVRIESQNIILKIQEGKYSEDS